MIDAPILNGRVIVQAERATRAALDTHLAGTATPFITWIPLNLIAAETELTLDALVNQLATGLCVRESEARKAVDDLVVAGFATVTDHVRLTDRARAEFATAS